MQIDIIFKIAAVGIIVTIVCQILKKSDREDVATIVSLAGLIIVLTVVIDMIAVGIGRADQHPGRQTPLIGCIIPIDEKIEKRTIPFSAFRAIDRNL